MMAILNATLAALLTASVALGTARVSLAAGCAPRVSLIARGYGSPDDVAVQKHRVLFGDLTRNILAAESNGRVRTLASGLSVPEGIVVRGPQSAVVVEQGANRLDTVNLGTGRRQVLKAFVNATHLEGIDGIAAAPNGGIYVPDSPYGSLYLLDRHGGLHLLASGMARPVAALAYGGGIAVADENDNAVWLLQGGRLQRLAAVSVPDDLALFHGALLTDSLGNGGIWEVRPEVRLLVGGFGQPQGMAVLNGSGLVVADSTHNGLFRVSNLAGCL